MTPPTRLIRWSGNRRRAAPSARLTSARADESLPVASTAIARLEYDHDTQVMVVTMARDGSQYTIAGMPEIEAHRWSTAASPGRYFNSFIRGKY
jgi:hypothetical protein